MSWVRNFERRKNQVQAVRLDAENAKEVATWCGGELVAKTSGNNVEQPAKVTNAYLAPSSIKHKPTELLMVLHIPNILKGDVVAAIGDWVVRTEDGRFDRFGNVEFIELYSYEPSPNHPSNVTKL